MTQLDVSPNLLRRHWAVVHRALLACGALTIVFGLLLNPYLLEKLVSSDGYIEPETKRLLFVIEAVVLLFGAALLWGSWRFRAHSEKRERIVVRALVTLGAVLVMLVFFEVGLRVIDRYVRPMTRQRHFFFQHDPQLGWSHRPDVVCTFKKQVVRINSHGLRDDEVPYEKPPDEFRILLLGDSQLFGDGVAGEDTLPSRLEKKLLGVQAINAGFIGYGTDQHLLFLRREGHRYRPDVIIVTLNAYDFRDNVSDRVRSGYRKPRFVLANGKMELRGVPVPRPDLIERVDRKLRQSICLYHFVRTKMRWRGHRAGKAAAKNDFAAHVFPPPEQLPDAVRVTERLLAAIATEAALAESRVVVAYLPYQFDFQDGSGYQKTARAVRSQIETFSRRNNVAFLDFCAELVGQDTPGLFLDTMHFNASGNDILARIIAERLTSLELVPPRHRPEE